MNTHKKLKILIIDDNKYDQSFLSNAVRKYADCEISLANNGKEGLNSILGGSPDLIFLDVSMPVMDGLTMLKNLKLNNPYFNTTIIPITAITDSTTIQSFFSLGVNDYLVKPVNGINVYCKLEKIFETEISRTNAA